MPTERLVRAPVPSPPPPPFDEPFPLARRFKRGIVPGLAAFALVTVGLAATGARWGVHEIYLEQAIGEAEMIARAVERRDPALWRALMTGRTIDAGPLVGAFADEAEELRLVELKVYAPSGRVLYATDPADVGQVESGEALHEVVDDDESVIVPQTGAGGRQLYEFYVPYKDPASGRLLAVFELYEPVDALDRIVQRVAPLAIGVPGLLLAGLVMALWTLVSRAQRDIDGRTRLIVELRRRLESFVSSSAVTAAHQTADGIIPSRRIRCTLLYSDVRDFSGLAENRDPAEVVAFLNRLMTVQVDAIRHHGGDVDKLVGDAVLARFDGADGSARAVAAGREMVRQVMNGGFPRGIGIGVSTGMVVSGALGPETRRDFTVIGDAVNVAARLCSAAERDELVVDADTLAAADPAGFGDPEEIAVKGRRTPVTVRRLRVAAPA